MKTLLGLVLTLFLVIGLSTEFHSAQVMAGSNFANDHADDIYPFSAAIQQEINHVVINEFELNPPGNDNSLAVVEWVELYNPTTSAVDIGGWTLWSTHGTPDSISISPGTILAADDYIVFGKGQQWLDNEDESVVLLDSGETEVDSTPIENDNYDDDLSWQRYYDGEDNWSFRPSTQDSSNGKDVFPPVISIQSPENGQTYTENSVSLTFSVDEETVWIGYSLNGEANVTVSGSTILEGLSDGEHQVIVYAEDNSGNVGASDEVYFSIDTNKPPVAVIGDPPSPVYINETVSFDASNSSDPEGPISHYYWDMGDGAIYNTTSSSVTHSYSDSGVYSITLTVTDDGGKTNTTTTTITVKEENEAPQASFTFLPTFPEVDETVTFDASNSFDPDGTIASYEWDFGDGNTATSITVSHVYDDNGNYSVTLTVTDDEGKNNQTQAIVAVMNRQPTASFTATPETADIGETIFFDASSSSDPDGTIDSYDWDFGDGHTSTDQTPTHTYSQKGTYTVKLTVTDDDGATDTAIISVEVSNQLPVAHLTYSSPSHVYTDKTVSFDASGSHDPDGNIISYVWNFGDENTGSGETISHSYSSSGVYTVSLTVTDNDGATDTATATITVIQNQPPVADAGDIPSDPVDTGEVISFDASHSSDPDGTISRYYWDMGDGKTYNTTSPTVAHSYSDSGVYTITLTVTDDGSKTSTTTTTITVIAAKQSPSASFEVSPTSPNVNETVNFDASDSSDSDGTVEDYVWEFGDGNTATGEIVTHIYSSNGTYTVTLTVTDNDSLTDTATMYVTVVQPVELDVTEPDPKAGEDQTVNAESEVKFDGSESTDNVGIVKYEWDFGDGKTGTGVNVTHAYKEAGNYTVTLTVEDAAGNRKSDTCAITVDGQETPNGEYIGRKPWSLSTVGEVALIGTAAVAASFVMLGHVISSFVPKWNIPNWLKDFLQLYLEDVTETLDKKKATGSEKVPFITKGELAAITVSALIMTAVFSFVETNGLPDFLNLSVLVAVVPSVLIAVLMDNFVEVFAEALCARACKVYRQVNFWMYGLVLFLVSSLLLFFPTGTPIITRYPNGESPDRKMVLIILLKSLILLTVALPFAGLYMLGFRVLGDTGLLMTLMLVFYYSLPVKPVVGKVVFDYNKAVGLSTWVLTGALFFGLLLNILPCIVYLIAGAVSVILAALTLWMLSKSPFETTVPKSNV